MGLRLNKETMESPNIDISLEINDSVRKKNKLNQT